MKSFLGIAICGFIVMASPVAAGAQEQAVASAPQTIFFHALNDVPVMAGLRELPDESINFDKPEGRIVTATAVSDRISPEKIQHFYDETLPQLGWMRAENGTYTRDQERLKLIVEVKQGVSIARLIVEPRERRVFPGKSQ